MSTPIKIKPSGIPFVPELRDEQNREHLKVLWKQFQGLDDKQTRAFAAYLFGSLEAMSCHEFVSRTQENMIGAIEGALRCATTKDTPTV